MVPTGCRPAAVRLVSGLLLALAAACAADRVPLWTRYEAAFTSTKDYPNALSLDLTVSFRSPSGKTSAVPAFWDGGRTWRVRFAPPERGRWTYSTVCSETADRGLHARRGSFTAVAPRPGTIFEKHGRVRLSDNRRYFVHEDGTPFFYLADTAWNGPLLATPADWAFYLRTRARQGFTAVQWVATQWRGSPAGDAAGTPAYTGRERIRVNPTFFQQLDRKHEALTAAGMLSVPVMLWAIATRENAEVNPGVSLPEDQAIRLARYMLARWGADPVIWILNGDGDYRGEKAARWRAIGRGTFTAFWHAPVTLHPGGRMWVMDEFRQEPWLDICGYQSSHGDSPGNSQWITSGPPAQEWRKEPVRPVISIEAPYEGAAGVSKLPWDYVVRRNHLWSLLNAPPAGITYGVHAVWAWSDGVHAPAGHGKTVYPHWKASLELPAALQMGGIRRFFESCEYWRLAPAPEVAPYALQSGKRDITVVYAPEGGELALRAEALPPRYDAEWVKPDTGRRVPASGARFTAPGPGDWLLLVRSK